MNIYRMTQEKIPSIATMMSERKPEWWDYEGAYQQLSDISESIQTIGWCMEESEKIKGFLLCRELLGYQTLELECCGFDDNGEFKLEHKLEPLMQEAENYAKKKGYMNFRSGISSVGFSIHGKEIDDIPKAIKELTCERTDYIWYRNHGFQVIGILPNTYGTGTHLILLNKSLIS